MRYPIDLMKSHPPGQLHRQKVVSFGWDGADAVDVTSGTAVLADIATTAGRLTLTTAATDAATAGLRMKQPISMPGIEAIMFTVEGFTFTEHNPLAELLIGLRTVGATAGVYAIQRATEGGVKLGNSGTSASETPTNYNLRGGIHAGNTVSRRLSLLLQVRTKELFLLAGNGTVVGYRDVGATLVTPPNVRPTIEITAREAAAKAFRVKQLRLDVWEN